MYFLLAHFPCENNEHRNNFHPETKKFNIIKSVKTPTRLRIYLNKFDNIYFALIHVFKDSRYKIISYPITFPHGKILTESNFFCITCLLYFMFFYNKKFFLRAGSRGVCSIITVIGVLLYILYRGGGAIQASNKKILFVDNRPIKIYCLG